ncbi:MAG: DUF6489 family protein [Oceanococcaceae bacterium]
MKVRIEIELTPEEFRQLLGLPDIAGMQEDLIRYARDKIANSSETFDPVTFLRDTMSGKTGMRAWRKFIDATLGDEEPPVDEPPSRRRTRSRKKTED